MPSRYKINIIIDYSAALLEGKTEINDKILFSLTKLIKIPDTPTNTRQAKDKVKGVILEIFYIIFKINITILLSFLKFFWVDFLLNNIETKIYKLCQINLNIS